MMFLGPIFMLFLLALPIDLGAGIYLLYRKESRWIANDNLM